MAVGLVASDIYPAVRRFLLESGLTRTLKAFDKETSVGDDVEAAGLPKKRAKAIRKMELTAVCQYFLESLETSAGYPTNGVATAAMAAAEEEVPRPKKRKHAVEEEEASVPEEAVVEPPKKRKKQAEAEEVPAAAEPAAEQSQEEVHKKKKKKDKQQEQKTSGVPFSRVDDAKWRAQIKDNRLIDNSHQAKMKYGGSTGDSWGDAAAADMLKVKGKGFRKEMAKKKRSSWRGGGEIDQGCNSIRLADSSDDE